MASLPSCPETSLHGYAIPAGTSVRIHCERILCSCTQHVLCLAEGASGKFIFYWLFVVVVLSYITMPARPAATVLTLAEQQSRHGHAALGTKSIVFYLFNLILSVLCY